MSNVEKIKQLSRQAYPKGRAFQYPENGNIDKLHSGLAISEADAFNECLSVLDSVLPDNDNFTVDDALRWEQFYGIISNGSVSLDDRKAAIIRKMNHPGENPALQSIDYLQQSLQLAGFNLYTYQNLNNQSIVDVLNENTDFGQLGDFQLGDAQLGDAYSYYSNLFDCVQLGDAQLGMTQLNECFYNMKVVNNIDHTKDTFFNIGSSVKHTFFVGGPTLGEFSDVDVNRRDELRQMILRIKPVEAVGFLLVNYI